MANYDDDSIIGDIADRVVKSGINRVVNSAKDAVKNILNLDNSKNKNDNTETDDENDDDDTEKYEQNAVIARKEYIDKYGIRQQVVISNKNDDTYIKAQRILDENGKEAEEIEVEVIGSLDYRIGWGVHVKVDWLPTGYKDCFMYVRDVKHTWKNDNTFTSTLTLTPSRVMDMHEWEETPTNDKDDESNGNGGKVIESAVNWAMAIAADDTHGYTGDRDRRWGGIDFDCSSFVITAFEQAGVQLKENGASYTGDLKQACLKCGFEVVDGWDKTTTAGLERGDILLNEINHACLYIGGGQVVNASQDKDGGKTGDTTGEEIRIQQFYPYKPDGWDLALRYIEPDSGDGTTDYSTVGIPDEYLSQIQNDVEINVQEFIQNSDKYNYRNMLVKIAKSYNIDPYTLAGIITIESGGNPNDTGGNYWGLCQTWHGSLDPATNMKQGCEEYNNMCSYTGYSSVWVSLGAYNFGNGNLEKALKAKGLDMKTVTIKQLGDASYDYAPTAGCVPSEKQLYPSKVLLAIRMLKDKNILG